MSEADIIVIGAGLSGLCAARKIHDAGKSVIVLEARDRVGGRTLTVETPTGGHVDLGASWINEHTQPHITALAREANNPIFEQNINGNGVMYSVASGERMSEPEGGDLPLSPVHEEMQRLAETVDLEDISKTPDGEKLDNLSVWTWYEQNGAEEMDMKVAELATLAVMGVRAREVSFLYFIRTVKSGGGLKAMLVNTAEGAQHQRTRLGNQTMSTYLASILPKGSVKLGHAVESVERPKDGGVIVKTRDEKHFRAKAVVLALPPMLYSSMSFTPGLPLNHRWAGTRSFLGYYAKCVLVYDKPWWVEKGYTGMTAMEGGWITISADTSDGSFADPNLKPKQYSLTCFITAKTGLTWSELPEEERHAVVKREIGAAFEMPQEADNTLAVYEEQWLEEWTGGAPIGVFPPGQFFQVNPASAKPIDRIFFAGTELSTKWKGYMEGAVIAGEKAADLAIEFLGK